MVILLGQTTAHALTESIMLTLSSTSLFMPSETASKTCKIQLAYLIHIIGNFHYPQFGLLIVLILSFILYQKEKSVNST